MNDANEKGYPPALDEIAGMHQQWFDKEMEGFSVEMIEASVVISLAQTRSLLCQAVDQLKHTEKLWAKSRCLRKRERELKSQTKTGGENK